MGRLRRLARRPGHPHRRGDAPYGRRPRAWHRERHRVAGALRRPGRRRYRHAALPAVGH